jgi:hypothetical protein
MRRKRSLESEWYDLFADWAVEDQAAALRTLTELHRQAVRQGERANNAPASPAVIDSQPKETS